MLWTFKVIDSDHPTKVSGKNLCVHIDLLLTVNNVVKGLVVTCRRRLQHFLLIPQRKHHEVSTWPDFFFHYKTREETTSGSTS